MPPLVFGIEAKLSHPALLRWSPLRIPAFRYERARNLSAQSDDAKFCYADDPHIRRTFHFMRAQIRAVADEAALERVRNQYPEVGEAYGLHHAGPETRHCLQARLLTLEPLTRTAERFDVSMNAVEFYEKVFFNFRNLARASDWMFKSVIVGDVRKVREPRARRVAMRGFTMRYLAWYAGEHALDAFLANGLAMPGPGQSKKVQTAMPSSMT